MASYRVLTHVFCMGINYKPGDIVPETVALALGSDCEAVEVEGDDVSPSSPSEESEDGNAVEKREKKPAKGIRRKSV